MSEEKEQPREIEVDAEEAGVSSDEQTSGSRDVKKLKSDLDEANNKYLRLYAEFDNYKKRVRKEREEFFAYCNEDLLYELLPAIDNLEMALKHTSEGSSDALESLRQGVENTLRELNRTLDKFGLKAIDATGLPFDPACHHAMSQIENDAVEDKTVLDEMRKGYRYKDKVLRPSLVAVSRKS
ncbi:MAG TPA: nucleotide exchange factor GrpE [Dissulfurispiraceae bacterium]|nr:nucleotide exchange factor GrpE [Dissulfurispiraceae bacterium]